ncbi:DUF481 domain-containing protein [bacterium]|jgi:putative salt-induced outer membrane protein YdiY|nr:DUF481 domain-containing protein [bacterium]
MKTRLLLFLFFAVSAPVFTSISEVYLKNRNRLSVSSMEFSGKKLKVNYFESSVSIPWAEVLWIKFGEQYVVFTDDGSRLVGISKEVSSQDSGFLNLQLKDGVHMDLEKSKILRVLSLKQFQVEERRAREAAQTKSEAAWVGTADLGILLQQGNTEDTKLNFSIKSKRASEFDVFNINLYAAQGETNGTENSNSAKILTRYDLKRRKDRFVFLLSSFEYDKIKKIDQRSVLGVGYGRTILDKHDLKLQISAGLTSDKENREDGTRKSLVSALFSSEFKIPAFRGNSIEGTINLYPDIKDYSKNLKADSVLSYVTPVTESSNLKFSLSHRFQQTVLPGVKKLDTLLSTNLSYSF